MAAARHQFQALARSGFIFGLGQNAAAQRDYGIARQDKRSVAGNGMGLFARHAHGIGAGLLVLVGGFVNLGSGDACGFNPQPRDQFAAARGRTAKDQGKVGQISRTGQGHRGPA